MPITGDPDAAQLRGRAQHLQALAVLVAERSIAEVRHRAGDDVWRGPIADRCRDELATGQRRLDAAVDDLRHHARVLERRAEEAELRAMTASATGLGAVGWIG